MRFRLLALGLCLGTAVRTDAAAPRGYVASAGTRILSVFDTDTGAALATLPIDPLPLSTFVDPTGRTVYVVHALSKTDGVLTVVDAVTNTVAARVPIAHGVAYGAVAPDGARLYLGASDGDTVVVVDAATRTVLTTLQTFVGGSSLIPAVEPGGARVWVADGAGTLFALDAQTYSVVGSIGLSSGIGPMVFSPDGSRGYLPEPGANRVVVFATASASVLTSLPADQASGPVALSRDGRRLWVAKGDGTVAAVDTESGTVAGTVAVGGTPSALALRADGMRLLVANLAQSVVAVVDPDAGAVVGTLTSGEPTFGLAISPGLCGDGVETFPEECDGGACCTAACGAEPDTATCAEGGLDPFLCYVETPLRGTRFTRLLGARLADAFAEGTVDVVAPRRLCAPATLAGIPQRDAATFLEGFRLRRAKGTRKPPKLRRLRVQSTLGAVTVDALRPALLLVPAAVGLGAPPDAPADAAHDVDEFACYRVRRSKGAPKPPKRRIDAGDAFTSPGKTLAVKRPSLLCLAADRAGAGTKHADRALVCHLVKPVARKPKRKKRSGVETASAIGRGTRTVRGERELCVPATVTRGS